MKITIKCNAETGEKVLRLLRFVDRCCRVGHSIRLEERTDRVYFDFDGDGADKIDSIEPKEKSE